MYSFQSRVRYSETDGRELLTLSAITDYFQDCGTFQSEELGLGVKYLQRSHMAWMLSAWQIVVEEYPKLGDGITVGTFPYGFKGFMGYRNYVMDREDGKRMAYANAVWTLLDTDTVRPVRATQELTEKSVLAEKLPMTYAPRKIDNAVRGEQREAFRVQFYHLDSNHHVNNAWYVKMAVCFLPAETDVCQMRVEYKKQAFLGDVIVPYVAVGDNRYVITLCNRQEEAFAVIEFTGRA